MWNFLTWSFLLAQVLGVETFVGGQAKAGEALDARVSDPHTAPLTHKAMAQASPEGDVSVPDDVPQTLGASVGDIPFQPLELFRFGDSAIDLEAVTVARTAEAPQAISADGWVVTSSSRDGGANAALADTAVDGAPSEILHLVEDVAQPLLETVSDIVDALTSVVTGTTDLVLETVGDVTRTVGDIVGDGLATSRQMIVGEVSAVNGLAGMLSDGLTQAVPGMLASAGLLTLPVLDAIGGDDLFNSGRYTDYGIEVHVLVSPAAAIGEVVAIASAPADVVTDAVEASVHVINGAHQNSAHLLSDLGGLTDRIL